MKMSRFLIVLLAALMVIANACKHTDKAEQTAALDNAYQAGLLTKDEYDAKKRALTGTGESPAVAPVPAPVLSPVAAPPLKISPPPAHVAVAAPRRASAVPAAPPVKPSGPPSGANAREVEPAPLAGCEDAEYKSGGQKGAEERFFAAPPEIVRRAAVAALNSLDFNIRKNSNKEIEASKKRHIGVIVGAGGERVILTFKETEREGQSGTRVIGQTKKNFVGHVSQRTWTDAVLAQIACKLSASSR
jgi:hypothetical protein